MMLSWIIVLLGLVTFPVTVDMASHIELVRQDPAYQIKFPKTPSPPDSIQPVFLGHHQELGMQSPPIGQIPEYFHEPTPREMWDTQVKLYRPAVYRGLLNGSKALTKWTDDDYLTKEYGDQEVLVEKKTEDRRSEPKRMTIEGFLQQYKLHNWYVVTIMPNVMRKDLKVPKPLKCSTFRSNLQELNLWIGTHGTRSMLHYDADNILHCVVSGRKDWVLIHHDHKTKIDMVWGNKGSGSGFSHLNVDSVNMMDHPELSELEWEYVSLYGGDCLYLPPQYLHQVRSYNRSVSATYLFYPRDKFDDSDCKNVDLDKYLSLDDVYVYWSYDKGQETVDMGYQNPVNIRKSWLDVFSLLEIKDFTRKEFFYIAYIQHSEEMLLYSDGLRKLFANADKNGDELVTVEEMTNLTVEEWKDLCRSTDAAHGPTKSELNENAEKTNASAKFNPRNNDYYEDIKKAKQFLKVLFEDHAVKDRILFPEFKKLVKTVNEPVEKAFLLLDANMNGVLSLSEVKKVSDVNMRHFSRMGYIYIPDPELHGGGEYEDSEIMENKNENDEHGESLNPIDDMLTSGLEAVRSSESKKLDIDEFRALFSQKQSKMFDLNFLFKIISASGKYITAEQFEKVLTEEEPQKPTEPDPDAPVVRKDRSETDEVMTKRRVFLSACDAMLNIKNLRRKPSRQAEKEERPTKDEL